MKRLSAVLIALTLTACGMLATPDPCSPELLEPVADELIDIATRFDDAFTLADNTPRSDLAERVADLQEVRRDAQALDVPACMDDAKRNLVDYMDAVIDGFILFMDADNPDSEVDAKFNEAFKYLKAYTANINDLADQISGTTTP